MLSRWLMPFVVGLVLLTGCAGGRPHTSGTLTIQNQLSGERDTVAYLLPEGGLNVDGAWRLSYLMRDVKAGEGTAMDPRLFVFLDEICSALRLDERRPVIITSGYRSRARNAALSRVNSGVAENSYHTRGQAIDFKIAGISGKKIAKIAWSLQRGGVAYYPSTGHVHIDTGPVRTWETD